MEQSKLTEKHNVKVYNQTTTSKKTKRRDKSDLGENFIAPDGGWGWVICIASGISSFSVFPCLQQYGLLFRDRLYDLKFSKSQITTIINIVLAMSSLTGLTNGAVFRRFTFRQIGICGGFLVFFGIVAGAYCVTFIQYVIFFSTLLGIGLGINLSSMSLAINTYFKKNRRRATGFSWTITGLGPILFPHIITFLLPRYGFRWTILTFAAISLNSVMSSLTLHPVLWHVRKPKQEETKKGKDVDDNLKLADNTLADIDYQCKYCQSIKRRQRSIFSSQYLFNADDADRPGYEITEPGTPMLSRANDGWYGSKLSLASNKDGGGARFRNKLLRQRSINRMETDSGSTGKLNKPNYFNREKEDIDRYASKLSVYSKADSVDESKCTCAEEKALMQHKAIEMKPKVESTQVENSKNVEEVRDVSIREKIIQFFDLDLLKDFTFVNLVLGMTVISFGEMNFSILTPLILNDFGFSDQEISTGMSILAGVDIAVRFFSPFFLEKIKLPNRVLFAFGISVIVIGRFCVALSPSYNILLGVFIMLGFGKGFRTIFTPLIIPSYVPLKRLPAASGLQLISTGIFTLACGPFVGMITDKTNYIVTIHCINGLTCLALFSWSTETFIRSFLCGKKIESIEEA